MKENRIADLENLAKEKGLDFFPIVYEVVSVNTMNNVCAYGLPTRARHWSYGRSYDQQRIYGEMGYSKVYEMITNNNPSYAFILDSNTEAQNLLIVAHCLGHCLVPGTLVETPFGIKKIEDLEPNDDILTHTGRFGKISTVSRRLFSGKIVKFNVGCNTEIISTNEHPFLVVRAKKCAKKCKKNCRPTCATRNRHKFEPPFLSYKKEWVKAEELRVGDFAVFPRKKILNSIDKVYINGSKGQGHPGGVKEVSYCINLDYDAGEFFGLYLAEGYSKKDYNGMGLCFSTYEKELHKRSKDLIEKLFHIKTRDYIDEKHHSHQILFNEKVLAKWLSEKFGNSCYTKKIPNDIFVNAGKDFFIGLLKGVFEGDGSLKSPRQISLTTTSVQLASQIRHICFSLGIICKIYLRNRKNRRQSYDVIISGNSMKTILNMMGLPCKSGNRSFEKGWVDKEYVYVPIGRVSTEECKNIETINLEVPLDSSYVLFGGISSHNSSFFKNNVIFNGSDRNMVRHAAEHANRIDQYIETYGLDAVERLMDIGFALDSHIDIDKGLYRNKYPKRHIKERIVNIEEYDDLLNPEKLKRPSRIKEVINATMPPHPEKDLLWFFINYAPLEDWERDVLDIVREEAFYFYPQAMTKIMNEGWAVYWHAELLYNYDKMSSEEMIDFARTHEKVVQPGSHFNINPYYLGYRIYKDIEKKWDEKYKNGESDITGRQKIFEVMKNEDDISFVRNYLSADLVQELKLFTFGQENEFYPEEDEEDVLYEIKSKMRDDVVESLIRPRYNNWSPKIVITDASSEKICLRHDSEELGTISFKYAEHVMEYIWELWAAPVELYTKDDYGKDVILIFDEIGFSIRTFEEEFGIEDEEDDEKETITKKKP